MLFGLIFFPFTHLSRGSNVVWFDIFFFTHPLEVVMLFGLIFFPFTHPPRGSKPVRF
jgi:hypothetical protein